MGIIIFFAVLFVLLESFLIWSGIVDYQYYQYIVTTPTTFVNELSAGIASIEGKVVSLSKKLLVSPLCGIQCVYFKFEAHEITGEDDDGFSINDTQYAACGVDGGSGFAKTDLIRRY
jgi:hypothetical protein